MIFDKIYIVHYKKLSQRKEYMIKQLKEQKIFNYQFMDKYDRDTIRDEIIRENYKGNIRTNGYSSTNNLNKAQICLTLTHIDIYKDIIKNNYKNALILEDDAILDKDFSYILNEYMKTVPDDYEFLYLNAGCGLHAPNIVPDKVWYKAKNGRTNCAYVVTKSGCEKVLKTIIPFQDSIDHELNRQCDIHNFNVYWCEPTIVTDGSDINGSSYQY